MSHYSASLWIEWSAERVKAQRENISSGDKVAPKCYFANCTSVWQYHILLVVSKNGQNTYLYSQSTGNPLRIASISAGLTNRYVEEHLHRYAQKQTPGKCSLLWIRSPLSNCKWEQFRARVWWWGLLVCKSKTKGSYFILTRTQLQFDTKRRLFNDEDNQILEQFAHSNCGNSVLGGCQQHSATCSKFSVEQEMGLSTSEGPSSLIDPVLIPHFLHSHSEMEGFFLYYLVDSHFLGTRIALWADEAQAKWLSPTLSPQKSWAPAASQTALPGHVNTKENHLGLSPENDLFFGWFDNQKLSLAFASGWSCVVWQLQWTPTFSNLQEICCHFKHLKLLVL